MVLIVGSWICHGGTFRIKFYFHVLSYFLTPKNSERLYIVILRNHKQSLSLACGSSGDIPLAFLRLRPDIRLLEKGDIDGAANEKNRLEEKQRDARKNRKKSKAEWKAR